jgi:hypothetical protein
VIERERKKGTMLFMHPKKKKKKKEKKKRAFMSWVPFHFGKVSAYLLSTQRESDIEPFFM